MIIFFSTGYAVLNKNGTIQVQFQRIEFIMSISSYSGKEKTYLIVIKYSVDIISFRSQHPDFTCNLSYSYLNLGNVQPHE